MTPVSKNEDLCLCLRDEENNGQEQEVALPSSNENEMAFDRPEEEEEPDDKDKEPSGNTNRWRPWSRSRTLNAFLAAAGVGVVVGTLSVVSLASSSSKTSISSSSMQALVQPRIGFNFESNFELVGAGECTDKDGGIYPQVSFGRVADAQECADKCKCVEEDGAVTFVGLTFYDERLCYCQLSNPITTDLNKFKDSCSATSVSNVGSGIGDITGFDPCDDDYICYKKVGGGNSKAGKTKAGKAEDK